jgi:hypothetical protein
MKRTLLMVLVTAGLLLGVSAAPAVSDGGPPPHPHMLVLGIEFDEHEEPVAFRKCVDLAAGQKLPLNAHHAHLHTGQAGVALFEKAGHVVVPGAPLTPWRNCAELIDFFFGG